MNFMFVIDENSVMLNTEEENLELKSLGSLPVDTLKSRLH